MGLALVLGSVPLLAVAFVIIGAGIGTLDVLINVEGAAVERAAGRTLMPMMHAAWSIGAAVGSGIGAACAALGITPAAQLIGEAVLIAAAALGTAAGIPRGQRAPAAQAPRRTGRRSSASGCAAGWTGGCCSSASSCSASNSAKAPRTAGSPWRCADNHGQTAAVAALFFTAFAACEGLTRIFAGPVVDRLGRVATIRLTTALGLIGIAAFILAGNRWIVLLGVVLWAVGVSMGFPLGMSAAAESGPDPAAQDQRRRLHRLLRQPRRAARHRRARPVRRPAERPVAHRRPCSSPPSPRPAPFGPRPAVAGRPAGALPARTLPGTRDLGHPRTYLPFVIASHSQLFLDWSLTRLSREGDC